MGLKKKKVSTAATSAIGPARPAQTGLHDRGPRPAENRSYSSIHSTDTPLDINLAVSPISSTMASKLKFLTQFDPSANGW